MAPPAPGSTSPGGTRARADSSLHAAEYLDEEDAPCAADLPDASPDEASLEDKRYNAVIRSIARGRILSNTTY